MKKLLSRIGRRGSFLLFLAFLDGLFSYALWLPGTLLFPDASWIPQHVWALIWAGVGVICFTQAFMKEDRIAFSLATGLKIAWGSLMLNWWIFHHIMLGWISVAIWWAFAGTIAIIAGWPEPPSFIRPDPPQVESDVLQVKP